MSGNYTEFSFCPNCGALVKGDICSECGTKLIIQNEVEEEESVVHYPKTNTASYETISVSNQEEKKEKSGTGIVWFVTAVAGFVAVIFVLLCVSVGVFIFSLNNRPEKTTPVAQKPSTPSTQGNQGTPGSSQNAQREIFDDYKVLPQVYATIIDMEHEEILGLMEEAYVYEDDVVEPEDFELLAEGNDFFAYEHENMPRSTFEGIYYNYLGDSFDYNQNYSLEYHTLYYENEVNEMDVSANVNYFQLTGDNIPNLEELNKTLYNNALSSLLGYLDGSFAYDIDPDYNYNLDIVVDSFVTYNDSSKISIVRYVNVYVDSVSATFFMSGNNIDLKTGKFLAAEDILNLDESFAIKFYESCAAQNSSYFEAYNYMTDRELVDMLLNDDTNIIFFSPIGIEIGMNYVLQGEYSYDNYGWATITLFNPVNYVTDNEYLEITEPDLTSNIPSGEREQDFTQDIPDDSENSESEGSTQETESDEVESDDVQSDNILDNITGDDIDSL